jgi:acetyl-CoA carboxylase biotin carboxyl carrier protein
MKQQDIDDLKQLIEFLKQYQVAEFDLDRGDLKIRLKFAQESASSASLGELARMIQSSAFTGRAAPVVAPAAAAQPAAAQVAEEESLHVVKSPIVGTFYASPSPGASAFVSPGDAVEKGQVICIVEAMKLMNEIESDAAGEIVKCLVSNGQAIEFGQPLFTIRTK